MFYLYSDSHDHHSWGDWQGSSLDAQDKGGPEASAAIRQWALTMAAATISKWSNIIFSNIFNLQYLDNKQLSQKRQNPKETKIFLSESLFHDIHFVKTIHKIAVAYLLYSWWSLNFTAHNLSRAPT